MMHLQIDLETETQSKLVQLQKHLHNDHNVDAELMKLASDVLKSALEVYAPKAYCKRCIDAKKGNS